MTLCYGLSVTWNVTLLLAVSHLEFDTVSPAVSHLDCDTVLLAVSHLNCDTVLLAIGLSVSKALQSLRYQ